MTEAIGVYDADGGVLGEAAYVWGKLRGTRHCGLCDITHGTVRRKSTWDRFVERLDVPFSLLHLNELPADVRAVVANVGAPVVLGRFDDGIRVLMDAGEIERSNGSVDDFSERFMSAVESAA